MEMGGQSGPAHAQPVSRFALTVVMLLVVALRLLHLGSALRSPLTWQPGPDEEFYLQFGQAVAAPGALDPVFAFMDPAYGYVLGGVFQWFGPGLFAIFLLQILVDTGTAFGIYLIGRELHRPRAGLIAAALYGLTASAILLATTMLKETWVAHFMVWYVLAALWLLRRDGPWRWLLFGVLCGLGVALRSNLVLMSGLALVLLPWLLRGHRPWRVIARDLGFMLAGLLLPLALLSWRNAQLSQAFSPIPNNGGVVLHQLYNEENPRSLSAAPGFVGYYHPAEVWRGYAQEAQRRLGRALSPHEIDDYWRGEAFAYMRRHPAQVASNVGRKLAEFAAYQEVPNNRSMADERQFSPVLRWLPLPFGWLLAFGLPGLFILCHGDRRAVLALAPIAVSATTVAIFFAEDRFRFPAATMLALGAGALIDQALRWVRHSDARPLLTAGTAALAIGAVSWLCSRHVPQPPMAWERVAWGYIKMGRLAEAESVATAQAVAQPRNAGLHEALGYVAVARGQGDEAIGHYRRAVAARPGSHVAHFNLAKLLASSGKRDQALLEAQIAARLSAQPDYLALVAELSRR